ncbi:class I SAM-dependent methyltransferase [Brachyspira pilosicoli]|uniref:O-methyltransferase n=1 Tax=Brachyspira pilosicoli TaxID=52584 RepID=UPI0030048704
MQIFEPEKFENEILDKIDGILQSKYNEQYNISEMSRSDRCFLNGIIRQVRPKKILEVGIAAGASSSVILNAINDIDDSKLYSIDYNEKYYRDNTKISGFLVEEKFPNLIQKWKVYRGGVAAKFLDEIGGEIDMCLLDTVHSNPGELLDFLMVLPYLKKNAVLLIHDIAYHVLTKLQNNNTYTCGILFTSINGKKITVNQEILNFMGNIGAIILDDNIKDYLYYYFYLLTFHWDYIPKDEDIIYISLIFKNHYGKEYLDIFTNIINYNKNKFNNKIPNNNKINKIDDKINKLDSKINKLINIVAWWIPFKKKRDKFRKKFDI